MKILKFLTVILAILSLFSCTKNNMDIPTNNKIKAKIAPDRPIKDTFTVARHLPI